MSDIRDFCPLWGEWEVEKKLGEGSFGAVWKVKRNIVGGKVYYAAVKHISIPKDESEISRLIDEGIFLDKESAKHYYSHMLQSISDEIDTMHKLLGYTNIVAYEDHKIIPKAEDIGYDLFLRMELLQPLTDRILQGMSVSNVVSLGKDIATAIDVLYDHNLIHRDIKPQNIFVNDRDVYKLGDYGTVRALGTGATAMSRKGTYNYMSPEIYNNEKADIRADIYSLGLVLYRLLNGNRLPFLPVNERITNEDSDKAVMRRISGEKIPAPKNADAELSAIVLKACAYDPDDRYRTPKEMIRALEEYKGKANDLIQDNNNNDKAAYESGSFEFNFASKSKEFSNSNKAKETAKAPLKSSEEETVAELPPVANKTSHASASAGAKKEPTPPEKKGKKAWLIPLIAVLVLGLIAGGLFAGGIIPPKPVETPVVTETPKITEKPTAEPTTEPTSKPTDTPSPTPTDTPTPDPTDTPTPTPTDTPTPEPTNTPTPNPTDTPTPSPTNTPTPKPTDTPTPEPTDTPTPVPTDTPTPAPTNTPTPVPTDTPTPEPTDTPIPEPTEAPVYNANSDSLPIGSIVQFGHYEQDGNKDNEAEPIEWYILDHDDQGILLISRYILDSKPFSTANSAVTWEKSQIRKWLNTNFFNTAFSKEERVWIADSNSEKAKISGDDCIDQGKPTNDKVFILSEDEWLDKYKNVFWKGNDSQPFVEGLIPGSAAMTAQAIANADNQNSDVWLLRGPVRGKSPEFADSYVAESIESGQNVLKHEINYTGFGIRPLIRLNSYEPILSEPVPITTSKTTLIMGIEYERMTSEIDSAEIAAMKFGETLSNDYLSIQVTQIKDNGEKRLRLIPRQSGETTLAGYTWTILPQTEFPEDLVGTWQISYEGKTGENDVFLVFHDDGTVGIFENNTKSVTFRMRSFAYSDGIIMLPGYATDNTYLYHKMSFVRGRLLREKLPDMSDIEAIRKDEKSQLKSVDNLVLGENNIIHTLTLLVDHNDADPNPITYPISLWCNPMYQTDDSVTAVISDPDVLEVTNFDGWTISLRGKKAGTAEISFKTYTKPIKASRTMKVRVLDSDNTVPDDMIGCRWSEPHHNQTIIFNKDGRYIRYSEPDNRLNVWGGYYLYHDGKVDFDKDVEACFDVKISEQNTGIIQLDNPVYNYYSNYYIVGSYEQDGETTKYLTGNALNSGHSFQDGWNYKEKNELQRGIQEGLFGQKFMFNEDGLPAYGDLSTEELWDYYCSKADWTYIDPIE